MRVAVFGGSFDPPHVGHALVSSWLLWTDRCDEVWWVPTRAHAFGKDSAPFGDRVALCRLVCAELPRCRVVDVEGRLATPSFTVHTLEALAAENPGVSLRLVIGADVLPETGRWKRWDQIERSFPPIVVGRTGWPEVPGAPAFADVSASDIRARLAAALPVDHLVSAVILERLPALYPVTG